MPRTSKPNPSKANASKTAAIHAHSSNAPTSTAQPLAHTISEQPPASKLARLIALLAPADGATIAELCEATGWQPHSVRGAMAGSLKKKGHIVVSDKSDGVRRYRLGAAA